MRTTITMICVAAALAGCATVKSNDGDTVTIEHEPHQPPEEVAAVALKSCQAVGKAKAEQLTRVKVNPALPGFMVRWVSSFRCA